MLEFSLTSLWQRAAAGATGFSARRDISMPQYAAEEARMQFRVAVFNLFNQTNYDNPVVQWNSGLLGCASSAKPKRVIQLGVRFIF
jgi:hypothetical protein